jgi:molybdopterin converting factor small subunit
MQIKVHFSAQLRKLAGCNCISVDADDATTIEQLIANVAERGSCSLKDALLDQVKSIRSSVLVFIDNELVERGSLCRLHDGSEITLTTLISGG